MSANTPGPSFAGRAPGHGFNFEQFIRQMNYVYKDWRYHCPPGGNQVYSSGERFVTAAELPDAEPVLLCQVKINSGSVLVLTNYGVEAVEYPQDAGGRTIVQQLPPIALYNMAFWNVTFRDIENKLGASGRNIVTDTNLQGQRVFQFMHSHDGAIPLIMAGPGEAKLFMRIEGLGNTPYQAPPEGLSFVGRLDGYTIPWPNFVPAGFEVGQPPSEPWNPKY